MTTHLKYTVRALGKEEVVPITHDHEKGYHVFRAPQYRITVFKTAQTAAWGEFVIKLTAAVTEAIKARQ
jgi:hypothetical protein